jgi:hypothetical protein
VSRDQVRVGGGQIRVGRVLHEDDEFVMIEVAKNMLRPVQVEEGDRFLTLVTKVAMCLECADIVSPYGAWQADRRWRWCQCDEMGVRWRDGGRGLIEVTALHGPDYLRVLGFNNMFLELAMTKNPATSDGSRTAEQWRGLHDLACDRVEPRYLFHKDRRGCWALVVRVGESGDVSFIDYPAARGPGGPGGA